MNEALENKSTLAMKPVQRPKLGSVSHEKWFYLEQKRIQEYEKICIPFNKNICKKKIQNHHQHLRHINYNYNTTTTTTHNNEIITNIFDI